MPVSDMMTLIDDDVEIAADRLSLNTNGYVLVDGRTLLHRLVIRAKKGEVIDHINGNKLDNRLDNLRRTTHQRNAQNLQGAQKNNKLGLRGVWQCRKTGRFRAAATVSGKKIYAGYFDTPEKAAAAAASLRRSLGFLDSSDRLFVDD